MENIPPTIVLHKHVVGAYTIFVTTEGPLVKNPMETWLVVIIIGTYQSVSEDSRWQYDQVSDLWLDVELVSDSSDDASCD